MIDSDMTLSKAVKELTQIEHINSNASDTCRMCGKESRRGGNLSEVCCPVCGYDGLSSELDFSDNLH